MLTFKFALSLHERGPGLHVLTTGVLDAVDAADRPCRRRHPAGSKRGCHGDENGDDGANFLVHSPSPFHFDGRPHGTSSNPHGRLLLLSRSFGSGAAAFVLGSISL